MKGDATINVVLDITCNLRSPISFLVQQQFDLKKSKENPILSNDNNTLNNIGKWHS